MSPHVFPFLALVYKPFMNRYHVYKWFNLNDIFWHRFSFQMPPKRPTEKATQKAPSRVSVRIAAASHEEIIDIDAELTDADDSGDEDGNRDDKVTPTKKVGSQASGILSSGPNAAPVPSVPSELATTQGRTAYDVRYHDFLFPLPINRV